MALDLGLLFPTSGVAVWEKIGEPKDAEIGNVDRRRARLSKLPSDNPIGSEITSPPRLDRQVR